jgi:hypothetical protein
MYSINELSLRAHVDLPQLAAFLSESLGVAPSLIGSAADFWERYGRSDRILVGLNVQWSSSGFRTFLNWYQDRELSSLELLMLAKSASKQFDTDSALGNFLCPPEDSADQFLVVTPDARLYRAYSTMNAGVFDVEYIGPSVPLADVIPNLKAAEADSGSHST